MTERHGQDIIKGSLPGSGHKVTRGRQDMTERVCRRPGCSTALSMYNEGVYCAVHASPVFRPVQAPRRRRDEELVQGVYEGVWERMSGPRDRWIKRG